MKTLISLIIGLIFSVASVFVFRQFQMSQFLIGWFSCMVYYTTYLFTYALIKK